MFMISHSKSQGLKVSTTAPSAASKTKIDSSSMIKPFGLVIEDKPRLGQPYIFHD